VTWNIVFRGERYAIPGSLAPQWEIDALQGEVGSGNTPPVLRFAENGPTGAGPGGITGAALSATVGNPMTIPVWVTDDGKGSSIGAGPRANVPVTLTWFVHQGPGQATFAAASPLDRATGRAATTATFDTPGTYLVRVRATEGTTMSSAGHAQCCWSNGFITVNVVR
jgi:hypothetical protein